MAPWLGWPLWNICFTNDHEYDLLVVSTSLSFPHSRLITGFVTRLTRRVPLVDQELLTLPEHLSSAPVLSNVRVTRSLVLCVYFVGRFLSICTFSFAHSFFYSSSIYDSDYHYVIFKLFFWLLEKWSHHNFRTVLFLIFLRCRFQGECQGRKQTFEDVVFVVERWNSVGINHEINLIIASHRFGYICRDFDSNLVYWGFYITSKNV